jgi:RNA polymerase sigma-70 factor (ECF subfamily)
VASNDVQRTPQQSLPVFATTHWSMVLAAGDGAATGAREALARLCQTYWYPLYAYVRRRGHSPHDAEELTQEFFLQLLEHNWVARADRSRGRFRSFLLMAVNRFLANAWDKAQAEKRGGKWRRVPWSLDDAESRFSREPVETLTPEQEFERQWALTLLDHVLNALREEYVERGQAALFDALKANLVGRRETQPYQQLGAELGMSEGSVKVAVFRLRQRYRQRLMDEIAHTVASPDEAESEVRHLFRALARR